MLGHLAVPSSGILEGKMGFLHSFWHAVKTALLQIRVLIWLTSLLFALVNFLDLTYGFSNKMKILFSFCLLLDLIYLWMWFLSHSHAQLYALSQVNVFILFVKQWKLGTKEVLS
jgi:hypothetical protein